MNLSNGLSESGLLKLRKLNEEGGLVEISPDTTPETEDQVNIDQQADESEPQEKDAPDAEIESQEDSAESTASDATLQDNE